MERIFLTDDLRNAINRQLGSEKSEQWGTVCGGIDFIFVTGGVLAFTSGAGYTISYESDNYEIKHPITKQDVLHRISSEINYVEKQVEILNAEE